MTLPLFPHLLTTRNLNDFFKSRNAWNPVCKWGSSDIAADSGISITTQTLHTVTTGYIFVIQRIVLFTQDITFTDVNDTDKGATTPPWDSACSSISITSNLVPRLFFSGRELTNFDVRFFYPELQNELPIQGYVLNEGETVQWSVTNNYGAKLHTALRIIAFCSGIELIKTTIE